MQQKVCSYEEGGVGWTNSSPSRSLPPPNCFSPLKSAGEKVRPLARFSGGCAPITCRPGIYDDVVVLGAQTLLGSCGSLFVPLFHSCRK